LKNTSFSSNRPALNILHRINIIDTENKSIIRNVIIFIILTWLPLLILSIIQGNALNSEISIPFLKDFEVYTKFLIVLPLIFSAEKIIKYQTSNAIVHFVDSGIIAENNAEEFEKCVKRYIEINRSKFIQGVILALVVIKIVVVKYFFYSLGQTSTWKYSDLEESITFAGYWYGLISLPLLQYFTLRLFWKCVLWAWLLWKVSKMNLNLVPIDPDKSGGLGFLGLVQVSFGILGFVQSAFLSSEIANKVVYSGFLLEDFKLYLILVVISTIVYFFPLFFFTDKLSKLKFGGLMTYGSFGNKYSRSFEDKWINGIGLAENEISLGSADIQSLADLRSSIEIIEEMKIVPVKLRESLFMIFLIAFPFLPLALVKYNPIDLFKLIFGFIL
jgi:hypothetical protein